MSKIITNNRIRKTLRGFIAAAVMTALCICVCAVPAYAHKDGGYLGDVPGTDVAISIDAERDSIYNYGLSVDVKYEKDREVRATGVVTLLYSKGVIYAFAEVTDSDVQTPDPEVRATAPWRTDSFEVFINLPNNTNVYDVLQFRIDCDGYPSVYDKSGLEAYGEEAASKYFTYAAKRTGSGYSTEFAIPVEASKGQEIGVNFQINDIYGQEGELTWAMVYSEAMAGGTDSWYVSIYPYLTLARNYEATEQGIITVVPPETDQPENTDPAATADGTATGTDNDPGSNNSSGNKLSGGAIAGIIIGALAIAAVIICLVIFLKKKNAKK